MTIRIVVLLSLGLLAGIDVSCSTPAKKVDNKIDTIGGQIKNELPNMKLTKPDGTKVEVKSLLGRKVILILFQPDCDHCQNEARQIAERLPAFKNYTVYFISGAALADIEKFSQTYKLTNQPNIHFAATDVQSIVDNYGPIPAPSIYIYSEDGALLNNFNGEMEIDVVIKYL